MNNNNSGPCLRVKDKLCTIFFPQLLTESAVEATLQSDDALAAHLVLCT